MGPAAKASPHQGRVHCDLLRLKPDSFGAIFLRHAWDLVAAPDFQRIAIQLRHRTHWLHTGMCQPWQFIFCTNLNSLVCRFNIPVIALHRIRFSV